MMHFRGARIALVLLLGGFISTQSLPANAADICESLFNRDQAGPRFLLQQNSTLGIAKFVDREARRAKLKFGNTLQKPVDKLDAFLERLERLYNQTAKNPRRLELLKELVHREILLKPEEFPESYFATQIRIAREEGRGTIQLTAELRAEIIKRAIDDQRNSIDEWLDYFLSKDSHQYPVWTKFWALSGLLKLGLYDPELSTFSSRSKSMVAPYPELNRELFSLVIDAIVKKAHGRTLTDIRDAKLVADTESGNFGRLYGYFWGHRKSMVLDLNVTDGVWTKYDQGSNHLPLVESLRGHNTGWCTAGEATAEAQLQGGDFYVYYSRDQHGQATVPRLAIRMEGDDIGEVRGIGKNQNIDAAVAKTSVLSEKLRAFGNRADSYRKRVSDSKLITLIEQKTDRGETLTKAELTFLYEFDQTIESFVYAKDPRVAEIKARRNRRADFATLYGVREHELAFSGEDPFKAGLVVYVGDIDLINQSVLSDRTFPKHVTGHVFVLDHPSIINVTFPELIEGRLYIRAASTLKNVRLSQEIRGSMMIQGARSFKDVIQPNFVGGSYLIRGLRSVDEIILPHGMASVSLPDLAALRSLRFPDDFNSEIDLRSLTSARGVVFPERMIHKSKGFNRTQINLNGLENPKGLVLPREFDGDIYLRNLRSATGAVFPVAMNGKLIVGIPQAASRLTISSGATIRFSPSDLNWRERLKNKLAR